MIDLRKRDDGFEELNLPLESTLDNKVYREAYRDLIKSKSCKHVTYTTFLLRMRERNVASRRLEYERRKIEVKKEREPIAWQACLETLKAGNSGKK